MSEDQVSDFMTAPAGDLQLAIRSVPETSAAINQTVRSVFRLFDLPVELQDLVLEYICVLLLASYQNLHFAHAKSLTTLQLILNSDIKNACLACKRFQTFFTPLLYSHMEVDGDYVCGETFARTLTRGHHGLKHVRTMRIHNPKSISDLCTDCARTLPYTGIEGDMTFEEQTARGFCRLLNALPKHSLIRLEYVSLQLDI
jgi:hypothetical protein